MAAVPVAPSQPCRFSPGDVVKARYHEGQWYLATVERRNEDSTFTIAWFDGDATNRVRRASELRVMSFSARLGCYTDEPDDVATDGQRVSVDGPHPEQILQVLHPFKDEQQRQHQHQQQQQQQQQQEKREEKAEEDEEEEQQEEEQGAEQEEEQEEEEEEEEEGGQEEEEKEEEEEEEPVASPAATGFESVSRARQRRGQQGQDACLRAVAHATRGRPSAWQDEKAAAATAVCAEISCAEEHDLWADDLHPGDIVLLCGHEGGDEEELEGQVGELVEEQEGRWLVELEGQDDARLVAARHILRIEVDDDDEYEYEWDKDWEPAPCYVIFESGACGEMYWDTHRSCVQFNVQLGSACKESFQILMNGDSEQRLYPDRQGAGPHSVGKVCGPDGRGAGRFWTIGAHVDDEAVEGAKFEIRLFIGRHGRGVKVDWIQVGSIPFGATRAAGADRAKSERSGIGPAPTSLPPNKSSLQMLLQSARPAWSWNTMEAVVEKLAKIEIRSGLALVLELRACKDSRDGGINGKLRAVGQKAFTAETLSALSERAEQLENEIRWRENQPLKEIDLSQFRTDDGSAVEPELEPEDVPEQLFRVVNLWAFVRDAPSLKAPILGRKDVGGLVGGKQQTFDGFVKLAGESGWMLRDTGGEHGLGKVLEPIAPKLPLVFTALAETPGPQRFFVLNQGTGIVRARPDEVSPILGFKHVGEPVSVVAQTYSGWLRVAAEGEPTRGGWMAARDEESGEPLMRCRALEEWEELQQKRLYVRKVFETVEDPGTDLSQLRDAIRLAREVSLAKDERRAAEEALERLQREQVAEQKRQQAEDARRQLRALEDAMDTPPAEALQAALKRALEVGLSKAEVRTVEVLLGQARSQEEQERRQLMARRAMQHRIHAASAAGTASARLLRACIEAADAAGMSEEASLAQGLLDEALQHEVEEARQQLWQRIDGAKGDENELTAVARCADEAGYDAEAAAARRALQEAAEARRQRADTCAELLLRVTAAAATRDPEAIRSARDAAKKAGATQKEIGRAFAAGQT